MDKELEEEIKQIIEKENLNCTVEEFPCTVGEFPCKVNWRYISINYKLSESFIEK